MKRYTLLIILLSVLVFSSCKKYLDVKPYGKVVPKTTEEFSALIQSMLNKVDYGNDDILIGNFSTVLDKDAITDNMDASIWGVESFLPDYVGKTLNRTMRKYPNLYSTIRDANLVIENVSPKDEESKDLLACTYAIRGIAYYNLIRNFSPAYEKGNSDNQLGLPIVTSFDIEERPLRSSLEKTLKLVADDLKKSIEFNLVKEEYRFTVDVARFFLAKMYFWSENWTELIPLLEDMVTRYTLLSGESYVNMMNSVNDKKGNVLLKSYLYYDGSSHTSYIAGLNNKRSRPVNVDFIKLFKEGDKDIRYSLSFDHRRQVTKILNSRVRGAELHFMLAEAYVHNAEKGKALVILNNIRNNRIEDNVDYTMETLPIVDTDYLIKVDCEGKALSPLLYALFVERQKEFFMEGDRWWELKRNGCPEFWIALYTGIKYTTKKYMYTAPIYKRDVELIKGLEQNEGYES